MSASRWRRGLRAGALALSVALVVGLGLAAPRSARAEGNRPPVAIAQPPELPSLPPEAPAPKPITHRPIFWIAIAGGAAVIAAGITLAVVIGGRSSPTVTYFPPNN